MLHMINEDLPIKLTSCRVAHHTVRRAFCAVGIRRNPKEESIARAAGRRDQGDYAPPMPYAADQELCRPIVDLLIRSPSDAAPGRPITTSSAPRCLQTAEPETVAAT